jgi:hypothetical protein
MSRSVTFVLGRLCLAAALSAVALLVAASPAGAVSLLSTNVTASQAVERTCFARDLASGGGFASRTVTAPSLGFVQARLTAAGGDWDLGVFDAETGRTVAGSAHFGSREVAEGVVGKGQRLVVQACRRSGTTRTANLSVEVDEIDLGASIEKAQLVRVSTPTRAHETKLTSLGLDLTEHGGKNFVGVVLHGADDAAKLRQAGFSYDVTIDDLGAQSKVDRRADALFERSVTQSALPSGRTTYRRLMDYTDEMKQLVREFNNIVRPITLNHLTYEGRPVEGIEISTPLNRLRKPVFLQMGVHHAREWPSAEHALEWAYQLTNGWRAGNPRVQNLIQKTRAIIIPIVNPDGFNISRETGEAEGGGGGRGGNETANIVGHPFEYRRKNCRFANDSDGGSCTQPSVGLAEPGVDPNRNYGGFWGGDGASTDPTAQDYRGPGPFSEPETQNVRELVSKRHVTALITNHTYSNLVLRPPGVASQGPSVDEPIYKALGDAMAAENGYSSQHGYQLYDTTGTTEDWSYYTTGGLGFTFEIGPTNFHPPFAEVVAEYEGTTPAAGAGRGNREAYFKAHEFAANPARHSVISGIGPTGAVLRLYKTVQTPTSQKNPDGRFKTFTDRLSTKIWLLPAAFEWHVNPSTRPLVAQDHGRPGGGAARPRSAERAAELCRRALCVGPAMWRLRHRGSELLQRPSVRRSRRHGGGQRQDDGSHRVGDARERLGHEGLPRHERRRQLGRGDQPRRQLGPGQHRLRANHDRRAGAAARQVRRARYQLVGGGELRGPDHLPRPGPLPARPEGELEPGLREPGGHGAQHPPDRARPRRADQSGPAELLPAAVASASATADP